MTNADATLAGELNTFYAPVEAAANSGNDSSGAISVKGYTQEGKR